jgi:hypothetical protein
MEVDLQEPKLRMSRVFAIAVVAALHAACGDDSAAATASASGTESTTGDTETSGVTLTTSVSADDTGRTESSATMDDSTDDTVTDTDTTTGPDTDDATATDGLDETGDPPVARPGQTHTQLVSAGTQSSSSSYSVVFTIGQPSKLQSTHDSTNYRLQGGLIGANGSPP